MLGEHARVSVGGGRSQDNFWSQSFPTMCVPGIEIRLSVYPRHLASFLLFIYSFCVSSTCVGTWYTAYVEVRKLPVKLGSHLPLCGFSGDQTQATGLVWVVLFPTESLALTCYEAHLLVKVFNPST